LGIKDAAILLVNAGSPSDFIEAARASGALILGIDTIQEACF
jgi:hypothetical protein